MIRVWASGLVAGWFFLLCSAVGAQMEEIRLKPHYILGSEEEEAPSELALYWAISVDVDREGNIYILDSGNQRVLKFDRNYHFLLKFGRQGQGPGEFNFRAGVINSGALAVSRDGRKIYVVDNGNARVQIFDSKGHYIRGFKIPWPLME